MYSTIPRFFATLGSKKISVPSNFVFVHSYPAKKNELLKQGDSLMKFRRFALDFRQFTEFTVILAVITFSEFYVLLFSAKQLELRLRAKNCYTGYVLSFRNLEKRQIYKIYLSTNYIFFLWPLKHQASSYIPWISYNLAPMGNCPICLWKETVLFIHILYKTYLLFYQIILSVFANSTHTLCEGVNNKLMILYTFRQIWRNVPN